MLLQFTVENFLSFDEPTNFSMRAGKDKDHLEHLIRLGKETVTRGAAIYGANAAGKSNLVLAMGFARDLIVGKSGASLSDLRPFRFGSDANRSSGFHWQFFHAGKLWSYGFDVSKTAVREEYLFARDPQNGREKRWFERTTNESGVTTVKLGAEFVSAITKDDAQLLKLKAPRLDANALFLREILAEKIEAISPVFKWFEKALLIVRAEETVENLNLSLEEGRELLKFATDLLRFADTGVDALVIEKTPWAEDDLSEELDGESLKMAEDIFAAELPRCFFDFSGKNGPVGMECDEAGNFWTLRFQAQHSIQQHRHPFPLTWESDGTRRLLQLAPALFLLNYDSFALVVDEIDRRLHTLLAREIVKMGLSESSKGQFIFTTHDTNLLDSALLRRDEIWFVDKNERGASSLVSLVEFKIRSDANYEKGYLLGAFDGIPYFGAPDLAALTITGAQ